jgi:glucose/arabinose dehydrogenase
VRARVTIAKTIRAGLAAFAGVATTAYGQSLEPFAASANLSWPVAIAHAGDGSGRLFFTGQNGAIWVHDGAAVRDLPFLDVSSLIRFQPFGEEGLLGTAFHPAYEANGLFYVYYTNAAGDNVLARYQVSADPNVANPASAAILLTIPHPAENNHNGGQLQFGPDGYLYVGVGDGGGFGDPGENAQDLGVLLGKILRLDVDGPPPYGIPPGNPFVGVPGARPEIWAYGLRNPWRFSFDRLTGDLFIGDVGQTEREEVDFQPAGVAGRNYGWDDMEGTLCYEPASGCLTADRVLPILEYGHTQGDCAVVGGHRYRGRQVAGLSGKYVYGDYCSRRLRVARETAPGQWTETQWIPADFSISALGEDEAGELYVARYQSGSTIYRIVGQEPALVPLGDDAVEGTGGRSTAQFVVRLSPTLQPVTARYETIAETANLGEDFLPVSGTLTFPPSNDDQDLSIAIPIVPDAAPEATESFSVRVFDVTNAHQSSPSGFVHIYDDDPPPAIAVDDTSVEEFEGLPVAFFRVRVWPPAPTSVVMQFETQAGTATSDVDYEATSGTLTFVPGASIHQYLQVRIAPDLRVEGDETFSLLLSSPVGAVLSDAQATATIVDQDAPPLSGVEVAHGASLRADVVGGFADFYRIAQLPLASYEAILDEVSGDAAPGLVLSRVGTDNVTTVQTAVPVGTGTATALRWRTGPGVPVFSEHLRVASPSCGTACGPDDTYRLRVRETTVSVARFNNTSGQVTILTLQNASASAIAGTAYFWDATGLLLVGQHDFTLPPRGSLAVNTAFLLGLSGRHGSITLAHDGPFGGLTGKSISLQPATGFSFDSPLTYRPR